MLTCLSSSKLNSQTIRWDHLYFHVQDDAHVFELLSLRSSQNTRLDRLYLHVQDDAHVFELIKAKFTDYKVRSSLLARAGWWVRVTYLRFLKAKFTEYKGENVFSCMCFTMPTCLSSSKLNSQIIRWDHLNLHVQDDAHVFELLKAKFIDYKVKSSLLARAGWCTRVWATQS